MNIFGLRIQLQQISSNFVHRSMSKITRRTFLFDTERYCLVSNVRSRFISMIKLTTRKHDLLCNKAMIDNEHITTRLAYVFFVDLSIEVIVFHAVE
jgi:hypothetical protein